tara:strand:+ start:962 stop:1654 length:693 start_codon:yes stop_codon:yes gene_type:complete
MKNNYNLKTTCNPGESGKAYRLGDGLILWRPNDGRDVIKKHHPNTIGGVYLKRHSQRIGEIDITLLRKVVDEFITKNNYVLPSDDDIVIHLRLGDIGPIHRKNIPHEQELSEVINVIETAIKDKPNKKVIIVTALHLAKGRDDKFVYGTLPNIISYLKDNNINYEIKSASIDEDFCFLVKAKSLICTMGGFSLLAYLCNENNKFILEGNSDVMKCYSHWVPRHKAEFKII